MSPTSSGKSRKMIMAGVGVLAIAIAAFAVARGSSDGGSVPVQAPGGGKVGTKMPEGCTPTHCTSPECEACTVANCSGPAQSCDRLATASERRMCEDLYACFNDPANKCVAEGDPLKCWCGTNPTTCVTSNDAPTQANGPCRDKVFEGVASRDAPTVWSRFVDPAYPLAPAANLTLCRGSFCKAECKIP